MAETIIFNLPSSAQGADPAYEMLWYQSADGINWGVTPVDTILVSLLSITNWLYTWTSNLADPTLYHQIKSRTQLGVESTYSIILPPRSTVDTTVSGISLSNLNGVQTYTLGDSIELLFKTDQETANTIGATILVDIIDVFDNLVSTVTAVRLGDLYVAEYLIPFNLFEKYNITRQSEEGYDLDYFFLKDVWNVSPTHSLTFNFQVIRKIESPTEDNNVLQIFLEGVKGSDNSTLPKSILAFTTLLNPFYASIQSVKDVYRDLLNGYDNFTIARNIINTSKIVDYHMMPKIIYREDAFNLARSNFVKFKVAWNLLLSVIQVNDEEKQLDNFCIKRSTAEPKQLLDQIENETYKYSLFIWAGGKDTPFVSKSFEKGLFDPNRPNVSRAQLDTVGWYPWTNTTTRTTIVTIDGNNVEVRGERTITFPYVRSRITNSIDQGDIGYLSGI